MLMVTVRPHLSSTEPGHAEEARQVDAFGSLGNLHIAGDALTWIARVHITDSLFNHLMRGASQSRQPN